MVYFLTNICLPNYQKDNTAYKYSHITPAYGRGVALELLEVNYAYWILHNNGIDNIRLVSSCNDVQDDDVVIFYNCTNNIARSKLDFHKSYKKIQIVTDQPVVDNCDGYVCYDPSIISRDVDREWFHVMYPLPVGLKKCKPTWPPTNITCISPDAVTLLSQVLDIKDVNIITDSYVNTGSEHVMFHLRKKLTFDESRGMQTRMKFPSHKTANRLYQSWFCNIPGIFSSNSAMDHIRHSEFDFLEANNLDELRYQINRLVTDKRLYFNMVDNCIERQNENNYNTITKQWRDIISHYENN